MTSSKKIKEQVYLSKNEHERLLLVIGGRAEKRSSFIRRIIMDEVDRLLFDKEKESLKLQVLRSMGGGAELSESDLNEFGQFRDAS